MRINESIELTARWVDFEENLASIIPVAEPVHSRMGDLTI